MRFDRALERLRADGFGTFVEVSPHPVLQIALAQGTEADGSAVVVGSLRRDHGGIEQALRAPAELHAHGVPIPWQRVLPNPDPRRADLPTYAFDHRGYWLDEHDDVVPAVNGAAWREDVLALPEAERLGSLVTLVTEEAAALLGRPAEGVSPDLTLREQGLDSLMVVELRNRIGARTRVPLPTVLAFDYPTPQAIASLLLTHVDVRYETPEAAPALVAAPEPPDDDDPVAIVSMACRLPDGIDTPEAFWELLVDGGEASSPFPSRWDGWDLSTIEEAERAATGRRFERRGGFVRDVEDFDAGFFGLSPKEALSLDPQQRLVLEVVWEAVERAHLRTASLAGSNTGVYLGAMSSDYDVARRWDVGSSDGYKITGNGSSLISGRVSYTLGLSGPALTVDTACSSSLVALRLACEALRSGACDLALAGGVTVMSTPQIFVEFSRLNGLAADGRCKSFADDADGTSWAEGCGVLVLKRLSDARRDGDRVLALVRGTAMNQDGRSQGLTAPNGLAQQRVLREALADGGLTPADIDAVEAHATGTVLGDPIETGALAAVFSGRVRPLHLGSAKSNIGHAQAASGVIGVIKMVMALQHEWLPRTLHAEKPNTRIDWSGGELSSCGSRDRGRGHGGCVAPASAPSASAARTRTSSSRKHRRPPSRTGPATTFSSTRWWSRAPTRPLCARRPGTGPSGSTPGPPRRCATSPTPPPSAVRTSTPAPWSSRPTPRRPRQPCVRSSPFPARHRGRSPSSSAAMTRGRPGRAVHCWSRARCSATPWRCATPSSRR
ncbi:hypothetical protein SGRI78S_06052 [Streptomyces griseus subsp. griseus]